MNLKIPNCVFDKTKILIIHLLPAEATQVRLIVEPSVYGPAIPPISLPVPSNILGFCGGTEKKGSN